MTNNITKTRKGDLFADAIKSVEALAGFLLQHSSERVLSKGVNGDNGINTNVTIASMCLQFAKQLTDAFVVSENPDAAQTPPSPLHKVPVKPS